MCEHYRTADQQGSLPMFSADLVTIPLLYTMKNIQVKKYFQTNPQNQITLQHKQISQVT